MDSRSHSHRRFRDHDDQCDRSVSRTTTNSQNPDDNRIPYDYEKHGRSRGNEDVRRNVQRGQDVRDDDDGRAPCDHEDQRRSRGNEETRRNQHRSRDRDDRERSRYSGDQRAQKSRDDRERSRPSRDQHDKDRRRKPDDELDEYSAEEGEPEYADWIVQALASRSTASRSLVAQARRDRERERERERNRRRDRRDSRSRDRDRKRQEESRVVPAKPSAPAPVIVALTGDSGATVLQPQRLALEDKAHKSADAPSTGKGGNKDEVPDWLADLVGPASPSAPNNTVFQRTVIVPEQVLGKVVGRGRYAIFEIQVATQTSIEVGPQGGTTRTITIMSSVPGAAERAEAMLQQRVAQGVHSTRMYQLMGPQ